MTPLEPGGEHQIRFVSADEWSAVLTGLVANCRPSCGERRITALRGRPVVHARRPAGHPPHVETLIEKVTSVQLYQHW